MPVVSQYSHDTNNINKKEKTKISRICLIQSHIPQIYKKKATFYSSSLMVIAIIYNQKYRSLKKYRRWGKKNTGIILIALSMVSIIEYAGTLINSAVYDANKK